MPTEAEYDLGRGLHTRYVRSAIQREDYAFMPEVVMAQRVESFCDDLSAALDAVDEQAPPEWLPYILLIAAGFWTAVWFIWRGLT